MVAVEKFARILQVTNKAEAVHPGHVHVGEDQSVSIVRILRCRKLIERLLAIRNGRSESFPSAPPCLKDKAVSAVVVDDQDFHPLKCHGSGQALRHTSVVRLCGQPHGEVKT